MARIHSQKIVTQIISANFLANEIEHIVISPGSRNAPFIIEFTHHPDFKSYSIVDERSAGFFALGMAQQLKKPVVLVCTSGSALLNYYPAIAEAFYSQIPLIVLSADRPKKWIDQGEGQTIRQHGVFQNHSYFDVSLLEDKQENAIEQNTNNIQKAIRIAYEKQGPVHINVPFDEPLYETINQTQITSKPIGIDLSDKIYTEEELTGYEKIWNTADKKMILVGQHHPSEFLQKQLEKFAKDSSVIILTENISNVYHNDFINNIDQNIFSLEYNQQSELKPDILITVGRNLISKKIKQFLREHKPKHHWHVEKTKIPPNTFDVLNKHFDTAPEMFFSQFLFLVKPKQNKNYKNKWLSVKQENKIKHDRYLSETSYSDLKVFDLLFQKIPENYSIHWGNSSTVRYAQLFDFGKKSLNFSNRGTSGIDGSTSTAIGAACASRTPGLLVTGDISFLYDSNGLWNKYIPIDFKIIVINNGGGDIFNFIPGPSKTKALNNFFVTEHKFKAKHLAEMFGFEYVLADNLRNLNTKLDTFFKNHQALQILEIDTSEVNNHQILKDYFSFLSKTP